MVSKGFISHLDIVFVLIYLLVVFSIAYILSKVYYVFGFFFYIAAFTYSIRSNNGGIYLFLMGLWLINFYRNLVKNTNNFKTAPVPFSPSCTYYASVSSGPSKVDPSSVGRLFGLKSSIIVFIIYLTLTAVTPSHVGDRLYYALPLLFILVASDVIPGVGGNSASQVLTILILVVLSILVTPALTNLFVNNLNQLYAKPLPDPELHTPTKTLTNLMFDVTINPFNLGISVGNFGSLVRGSLGYVWMIWLLFDDIMGPGYSQYTATTITTKSKEIPRMAASIFNSPALYTIFGDLVWNVTVGNYLCIMVFVISASFTYPLWITLGAPLWSGRGAATVTTLTNGNVATVHGDGPLGLRKYLFYALSLTTICIATVHVLGSWGVVVTLSLFGLVYKEEQLGTIVFGVCAGNIPMMFNGIFHAFPISGSIVSSALAPYTVGTHSTGNNTTTATQDIQPTPASVETHTSHP